MYVSMNSFSQLVRAYPSAKGGSPPMAAASGQENLDVVRWPIADTLDREPYRFEFFQAVRLLERMYPRRGVGGASIIRGEKWCALARIRRSRFPPARFNRSIATPDAPPVCA